MTTPSDLSFPRCMALQYNGQASPISQVDFFSAVIKDGAKNVGSTHNAALKAQNPNVKIYEYANITEISTSVFSGTYDATVRGWAEDNDVFMRQFGSGMLIAGYSGSISIDMTKLGAGSLTFGEWYLPYWFTTYLNPSLCDGVM